MRTSKHGAAWMGGRLEEEAPQRLICRRRRFRKRHTRTTDIETRPISPCTSIHLTSQPRAWPLWLKEAGIAEITPRGQLWLDSVPAMLEAAEQGLGVTLAMAPLIKARPGFGKKPVAPFDLDCSPTETIYLVSRIEQARDRAL